MTAISPSACPNCGARRHGRFCQDCGQDNRYAKLRFGAAAATALDGSFGVDGRVWRTIARLTTSPGGTTRAFLDGKRARFVHPIRYALVACALWWGVLNVLLSGLPEEQWQAMPAGQRWVLRHGNWLNLVIVSLASAPLWLLFVETRRGLLEHLYLMLFASGHTFLWRAGLTAIGPWLPLAATTVNRVESLVALAFLTWAVFGLHRGQVRLRWLLLRLPVIAVIYYGCSYATLRLVNVLFAA